MTIELRVLTGARAGHRARFDGASITIGRHPTSDFQLDTHGDLDVSSRHAEVHRAPDGTVTVTDLGSTNGTFVNGMRVTTHVLRDGDVVQLGVGGPRVEVRTNDSTTSGVGGEGSGANDSTASGVGGRGNDSTASAVGGRGSGATAAPRGEAAPSAEPPPRRSRPLRAAALAGEAARSAQRPPRRSRLLAAGALAVILAGAYHLGARRSADEVAELRRLVAGHDSMTQALTSRLRGVSDSTVLAALRRSNDSLRAVVQAGAPAAGADVRGEVARMREGATALAGVDLAAINARNAPAVAYLVAEVGGQVLAGTAFAITADGALLTNRHLVRAADGTAASRVAVKFRDQRAWRTAHVVRVAQGADDDLALLRLDDTAVVPAVRGLSEDNAALREGDPIVSIGYPLGRATVMDGDGEDFIAKTSLYPGTVSKVLPGVLQLAAFAGHGSSGSPILDASGLVAGVVWGGARESAGRIVYAVPAARVAAFLRGTP